jgi:hypothetical protein
MLFLDREQEALIANVLVGLHKFKEPYANLIALAHFNNLRFMIAYLKSFRFGFCFCFF